MTIRNNKSFWKGIVALVGAAACLVALGLGFDASNTLTLFSALILCGVYGLAAIFAPETLTKIFPKRWWD